eukprot:727580-Amphidinium_carterae.1
MDRAPSCSTSWAQRGGEAAAAVGEGQQGDGRDGTSRSLERVILWGKESRALPSPGSCEPFFAASVSDSAAVDACRARDSKEKAEGNMLSNNTISSRAHIFLIALV